MTSLSPPEREALLLIALTALVATVLGLSMLASSVLALRHRRTIRQPVFSTFPLDPAARRLTDAETHPDDPDTTELPTITEHP